jgi:hypothetical protein
MINIGNRAATTSMGGVRTAMMTSQVSPLLYMLPSVVSCMIYAQYNDVLHDTCSLMMTSKLCAAYIRNHLLTSSLSSIIRITHLNQLKPLSSLVRSIESLTFHITKEYASCDGDQYREQFRDLVQSNHGTLRQLCLSPEHLIHDDNVECPAVITPNNLDVEDKATPPTGDKWLKPILDDGIAKCTRLTQLVLYGPWLCDDDEQQWSSSLIHIMRSCTQLQSLTTNMVYQPSQVIASFTCMSATADISPHDFVYRIFDMSVSSEQIYQIYLISICH